MPTGSEQYSSGTTPMKSSTPRMLLVKELIAINAGSGGGGSGQIMIYTTDPTTDGLVPTDQTKGAIATKNGGGTIYTWNTSTHVWE